MSEIKAFKKFLGIIVTAVFFFVPLAIILGAYGTIFHIARAHARGVGKSSFKKVMGFLYFIIFLLNQKRSWLWAAIFLFAALIEKNKNFVLVPKWKGTDFISQFLASNPKMNDIFRRLYAMPQRLNWEKNLLKFVKLCLSSKRNWVKKCLCVLNFPLLFFIGLDSFLMFHITTY